MCFILHPWATRRASSSSWSANGAFDTTETASAPRDSNARRAAPSSTVQTRRWRGARRQGAAAAAANALYMNDGATLDDLSEAVTTLEETARTARRVLGGAHPLTVDVETNLQDAQATLAARETPLSLEDV